MNVLLIDTSTRTARVGLIRDEKLIDQVVKVRYAPPKAGAKISKAKSNFYYLVDSKEWESTPELGKKLIEEIDGLLAKHSLRLKDIERVAVHRGRAGSSFMALRTGIVTGTMLAEGIGAELVPIEGNEVETIVRQSCQGKGVQVIIPHYETSPPASSAGTSPS